LAPMNRPIAKAMMYIVMLLPPDCHWQPLVLAVVST
jgi:hypothetical protein